MAGRKNARSRKESSRYRGNQPKNLTSERARNLPLPQQPSDSHVSHSSQDLDNSDIPGFYFDSETQTYFRVTPENRKFYEQKKIKERARNVSRGIQESKSSLRKHKYPFKQVGSLTSEILLREYQCLHSPAFEKYVLSTRLKMMREVHRTRFSCEELVPERCQTMVGNPECGSVIGAWTTDIGTMIFNHPLSALSDEIVREESSVVNIHFQHVMTDMCVAKVRDGLEFVLYVGNLSSPSATSPNTSTVHLLPVRQLCDRSTSENRLCLETMSLSIEPTNTVWSCAWNQHRMALAFGSEGYILFHDTLIYSEDILTLPRENVFSLEFNKSGTLLYSGVNKGYLKCFDLRTQKLVSNIKLTRGLSYLQLLNAEEHIIASCYDHKLLQVDLRAQKVVLEYAGHHNEHLKLPVSVSEKNNFICSVGQDRCTRIWDLRLGNLVSLIEPVLNDSFQPYAWFSEDWQFGSASTETALVVNTGIDFVMYKP